MKSTTVTLPNKVVPSLVCLPEINLSSPSSLNRSSMRVKLSLMQEGYRVAKCKKMDMPFKILVRKK